VSYARLVNEPCTLTSRTESGPVDRYGNPTVVETTTSTVCYAEQKSASENTVDNTQVEVWEVDFLPDEEVDGLTEVTIPGRALVLEIVGPPHHVRNPRTQVVEQINATGTRVT